MKKIAVIGAGVIGLTSAIRLQEAGFQVRIFTKAMPQNTTSTAAGAFWWGYGDGKIREWAKRSLAVFQQEIAENIIGIKTLRLRDVYRHKADLPWFHADIAYCEALPQNDLNPPFVSGFMLDVPLVEPPLYLPYLLKRFQDNGGDVIQKEIHAFSDLSPDYPLIINCTGLGANKLANDKEVYPIRGQTVILDAPDVQIGFMDDETLTYILPRSDGVLIGGTHHANQFDLTVDPLVREDILERCTHIDERLQQRPIVRETIGLRPGRYEVRLEAEQLSDDCGVIHNYGHAGIGFTLSWGCADNVVQLAQEANTQ